LWAMAKPQSIHFATEGLSREEVIVLLVRAFGSLKWYVEHLHPMRIVANTPWSAWSYGEVVTVEFDDVGFSATCKYDRWNPIAGKKRLRRNLDRLVEAFASVRGSLTSEAMAADLEDLREGGIMELDASTSHANESKWKDFFLFFVPRKDFWATPLLIDISVLAYIFMVLSGVHFMEPPSADLVPWGANFKPATLGGEWWRVITCCFVHIGLIHLLVNMYALAVAGIHLEPLLGRWRVILLYFLTGVASSMVSLWWHDNTVSAGASGAIFGLYGIFLALLLTDLIEKEARKSILGSIGIFVAFNLLYGLKAGVDNAAHMGGLLSGILFGFALYPALKASSNRTLNLISLGLPGTAVMVVAASMLVQLGNDDLEYQKRMEVFYEQQEVGMAFFDMWEEDTADDVILEEIRTRSIPAWKANRELLSGLDGLKLSGPLGRQYVLHRRYCDLRVMNCELAEKLFSEGEEPAVRAEFDRTLAEISAVVLELNGLSDQP